MESYFYNFKYLEENFLSEGFYAINIFVLNTIAISCYKICKSSDDEYRRMEVVLVSCS